MTTLRGVFLTSEQPAETARFYREVTGLAIEEIGSPGSYIYWKIDDGRMQLAIHDAKAFADYAFPPVAASNLTHLYFKIPITASYSIEWRHSSSRRARLTRSW